MDTSRIRETLVERRSALDAELRELTAVPRDPAAAVSFGKRIGDGTTEAVERINQTAAARSISASMTEVDRALAKLDEGSYGLCDGCGTAIPAERLEAIPWTALCIRCSAARR